jgi:Protein of unknown function (DUF3800)
MGSLVATGGVVVPAEGTGPLENGIDDLCRRYGFPEGQEFKWSPGRDLWMRDNLVSTDRSDFFLEVIGLAADAGCCTIVVIEDTHRQQATSADTPELDTVLMFLERVDGLARSQGSDAIVIADQPGGGRGDESDFLRECLQLVLDGTEYAGLKSIPINVLTADSRHMRQLQLADLVTSCTTAFIAGEGLYAPQVFDALLPLAHRDWGCIGGRGIKIHPDGRYRNLYHWLLGDEYWIRSQSGWPLPLDGYSYASGPVQP